MYMYIKTKYDHALIKYLWLGKLIGFGTATFPNIVMPLLLVVPHLQINTENVICYQSKDTERRRQEH